MTTNNLHTFRILHTIRAVLLIVFALFIGAYFGFFYFVFVKAGLHDVNGTSINPFQELRDAGLGIFPDIIIGVFAVVELLIIALIVLNFMAASAFKKQKNYGLIFTTSILNCFTGILGILLGVFSLVEITKKPVKALFKKEEELFTV